MDINNPQRSDAQRPWSALVRSMRSVVRGRRRGLSVTLIAAVVASGLVGLTAPLALADDTPTPTTTETAPAVETSPPAVSDAPSPAAAEPAPEPEPAAEPEPEPVVETSTPAETTTAPAKTQTQTPTSTPADEAAPLVAEEPSVEALEADAPALLAAAAPAVDCGSGTDCGRLKLINTIVGGGSGTTSSWTLTATSATRIYTQTHDSTSGVARPDSYVIAATPVNATIAAQYTTTVACSVDSRVSYAAGTQTLTYQAAPTSGNRTNNRTATCTFTHTKISSNAATIVVKVGGDRTPAGGVTALAGVTLQLFPGGSSGPSATGFSPAWATCVSDASGNCTFTIPDTDTAMTGGSSAMTGGNKDRQFWVKAISAPSAWFLGGNLVTGENGGTFSNTAYTFRTPAVTTDATITSGSTSFMGSGATSGGTWQVSRSNPVLPNTCGIKVGLLVDLSGSLSGQLSGVKTASKSVVDALEGTASTIGVYTFAQDAPASAGGANLAATAVSTAAGANTVRTKIDGFTTPTGGTDWDEGLRQIPVGTYNVIVIVTDGNPTYFVGGGNGNTTSFVETENAVFSANELKAGGARVVALGVGAGVSGASANLVAVSGDTANSDYFQVSDFTVAKQKLRELALGNCAGTISVVKQIAPSTTSGEDVTGSTLAGGWNFSASTSSAGVTLDNTTGTTAGDTGVVSFGMTSSGATAANVTITEAQQPEHSIVTQGGKNAVCVYRTAGSTTDVPLTVTNTGTAANPGFTVANAPTTALTTCKVYNRPAPAKTSITVDKAWSINGAAAVANDQNPLAAQGVSASLKLADTDQAWGEARDGLTAGSTVKITETTSIPSTVTGCTATGLEVRNAAGTVVSTTLPYSPSIAQDANANRYTVVNKLTCASKLTLVKNVAFGTATADKWTLTATAPAGALAGPSGKTGTSAATGTVTAGSTYTLSESGGPATYLQTQSGTLAPSATGSWRCEQINASGTVIGSFTGGADGTVTVPLGVSVRCTADNKTASLTILKRVINDNGGTATPASFTLTATPNTFAGLSPFVALGSLTQSAGTTFEVRPGHVYTLTESAVAGYANTGLEMSLDGLSWSPVTPPTTPNTYPRLNAAGQWELVVGPGTTTQYRLVNDDVAPKLTLTKAVVNNDGGTATDADWTLTATPTTGAVISGATGVSAAAKAGVEYTLSESSAVTGYALTSLVCSNGATTTKDDPKVTLKPGDDVTCAFTNDDKPGTLTLKKTVTNTFGGNETSTAWNGKLTATGATTLTFDHNQKRTVAAGSYGLAEGTVTGYTQTGLICTGGTLTDATVVVPNGTDVVCTFTNTDVAPIITFVKIVNNSPANGGAALATDWTLSATAGATVLSGKTTETVTARSNTDYTLGETGPGGYTLSDLSCTGGHDSSPAQKKITLAEGEHVTCTFTNTDQPAQLTLVKNVTNNHGGTAGEHTWDEKLIATDADGAEKKFISGTAQSVTAGTYTLSELGVAGYERKDLRCTGATLGAGDTVSLAVGQSATCTFYNEDVAPTLTLKKIVSSANGATASASSWTLVATGGSTTLPGVPGSTDGKLVAGVASNTEYTLSEAFAVTGGASGFSLTNLTCGAGHDTSVANPKITLAAGENAVCTFTNTGAPASLELVKEVLNPHGGTKTAADWAGKLVATKDGEANGIHFASTTVKSVDAGTYTLSEDAVAGYTRTNLVCEGATLTAGDRITLTNGQSATCTFTNEDIAPTLTLKKVVVNNNGGEAESSDWTLVASAGDDALAGVVGSEAGADVSGVKSNTTYTLSETGTPSGYSLTNLTCGEGRTTSTTNPTITLTSGEHATCTFTNADAPAYLTLHKTVNNNHGGGLGSDDWDNELFVTSTLDDSVQTFEQGGDGTLVAPGTYTLSETQLPGYEQKSITCSPSANYVDGVLTIGVGDHVSCTFVNEDIAPKVTLVKTFDLHYGGSDDLEPWTLSATPKTAGPAPVSGASGTQFEITAGVAYALDESGPGGYELANLSCTSPGVPNGVSMQNPTLTLPVGATAVCTFTNRDLPAQLTLAKDVTNDDGGQLTSEDWDGLLHAGDTAFDHDETIALASGTYALWEDQRAGYTQTDLTCSEGASLEGGSITLSLGESATCTFHNDDIAPVIRVHKIVVTDDGGSAEADAWTLAATPEEGAAVTGTDGDTLTVRANTAYTLGETGPDGYDLTDLVCTPHQMPTVTRSADLGVSVENPVITLQPGDDVDCTFTNDDRPAHLTLVKKVLTPNGGTATAEDWNNELFAGDIAFDSGVAQDVSAGAYQLSETEKFGYTQKSLVCSDGATFEGATLVLATDESVTCTFTNEDIAPTLTVHKTVVTDDGGTEEAGAWTLSATPTPGTAQSGHDGDTLTVRANTAYTLGETGPTGYDLTNLVCEGVENGVSLQARTLTLTEGQHADCTFTNDDRPGSLTLTKKVLNTSGGTAHASDWDGKLHAGDLTFASGEKKTVAAGSYALAEDAVAGYAQTNLSCSADGTPLDGSTVTVGNGQNVSCVFTNDDVAPRLTLVKDVDNAFGGTAQPADWQLLATTPGGPNVNVTSGATTDVKANAVYTFSEVGTTGFTLTDLVCEQGDTVFPTSLEDRTLTLGLGADVTCTFTNTELPGTLTLHKTLTAGVGGSAQPTDWNGHLVATAGDDEIAFDHDETQQLPAGTYGLREIAAVDGYDLTRITCDGTALDLANPQVTLVRGENADCTFTNTARPATLVLVKEVDNSTGGSRTANEWTLGAKTDAGIAFSGTGALQDDGTAVISHAILGDTAYSLFETGPSGYDAGAWQCTDGVLAEDGTVSVAPGETATCVIVNAGRNGQGSVAKTVVGATQHADGTWTVVYRLTVTNGSNDVEYRYSLTDQLRYGAGITVTDATWSGDGRTGSFTGGASVLATDRTVAAGATVSYLVTVDADVDAEAFTDGTTACFPDTEDPAGGFLNKALLTDETGTQTSEACAEPIAPTVAKDGVSATQDAETGDWTLTYRVTVGTDRDIPAGTNVDFSVVEKPELPASFALAGGWTATAEGSSPAPDQSTWDGTGTWNLVEHDQLTSSAPTRSYLVSATVTRTEAPVEVEACDETDMTGVVVWNGVTLTSGAVTVDDEACLTVEVRDVSLVKKAVLADGQTSVEPGDAFRYDLVVTNNGSQLADDVKVTDTDINARLRIDGVSVTGDVTWGPVPGYTADGVDLTIDGLAPGASATVSVYVTFLQADLPAVGPETEESQIPDVLNTLENTACVSMAGDEVPDNDCGEAEVPTRDLVAFVYTRCVGDAPYLGWEVRKSDLLKDLPVSFVWTPDGATATTDPASVELSAPGGSTVWTNVIEWPGAEFTPSGVSIDYPGWRPLQASDYTADGGFYLPGTTTPMTAEQIPQMVFNGLILDDRELDYTWRFGTTITFSVNPSLTFTAGYPSATPSCYVPRHTELAIEKNASAETVKAGEKLDYTIDVRNISDDSAAGGVVLTDEIPATIKVTDVTWDGKDDADVFPNWKDCTVTGSNTAGYGGTLECTLFGPLQPVGAPGVSLAPQVRIAGTVAAAASGEVVNVAVVDYHTFDDATDVGRATDDAKTTVTALPPVATPPLAVTGLGGGTTGALWLAGLLVLLGAVLLRRRRAHKM